MFASIRDTRLYYETMGHGPPLMIMHGGLGLDHTYLRPWLEPLADTFSLVFYDHRGNGRSDHPVDWGTVDHTTWIEDADALREYLGYDSMYLFGHSYGAFLALEYAAKHEERLLGLSVCAVTPRFDYGQKALDRLRARSSSEVYDLLRDGFANPDFDDGQFAAAWRVVQAPYFHNYDPRSVEKLLADVIFSAPALRRSFGHCLADYDVVGRLEGIGVPVLVLSGVADWITPPEEGDRVAAAVPRARLVAFEQSGHYPFLEEQDLFIREFSDWAATEFGLQAR